jgi:hypothetical protein
VPRIIATSNAAFYMVWFVCLIALSRMSIFHLSGGCHNLPATRLQI